MFESLVRFAPQDPARVARAMHDRGHQLVWTLFGQNGAARDFLYQPIPGYPFSAVVRSTRPPQVGEGWSVTTRPFAPKIEAGQPLAFRLETVPFRWKLISGARRGRREDLVTSVRRSQPKARNDLELEASLVHGEALRWFAEQGTKHGFVVASDGPAVSIYDQEIRRHDRASSGRSFRFKSFVFEGRLLVTDTEKFRMVLQRGVGAEKAFGFGLMQIARAWAGSVAV